MPNLSELTIAVSNLVAHAEELHRGVHHFQPVDVPDQSGNNRDSVTDDGVLLEVMIDALISVFKMVIAAARYVKRPKKQDSTSIVGPNSNVREWHQEAEAKLKDAKDQLIVESEVQSRTESVGSVVTPETTMILFLKRLASGVYGDSCIDIVGVYEECFQQLVRIYLSPASEIIMLICLTRYMKSSTVPADDSSNGSTDSRKRSILSTTCSNSNKKCYLTTDTCLILPRLKQPAATEKCDLLTKRKTSTSSSKPSESGVPTVQS